MVGAGVLGLPYAMSELGWYISNPNFFIIIILKIILKIIFIDLQCLHKVK